MGPIATVIESLFAAWDVRKILKDPEMSPIEKKKAIGKRLGEALFGVLGGAIGAVIGQIAIPIPFVGALIGAIGGDLAGRFIGRLITGALGEEKVGDIAGNILGLNYGDTGTAVAAAEGGPTIQKGAPAVPRASAALVGAAPPSLNQVSPPAGGGILTVDTSPMQATVGGRV